MISPTCTPHEWTAPDGETFPYSVWKADVPADQPPRAVIVAVHGLSGAALDYEPLGSRMAQHGVATYAPELRGQGNDPVVSRRGDLLCLEDWFADLSAFFLLVRVRHPHAQIYYYGESMGAALLTRFLAKARSIDLPEGLILAAPVVEMPQTPTWWQEIIFRFFLWIGPAHRIDVSEYTKRTRDDRKSWLTRDEAHRQWIEIAPHRVVRFTVRFFHCLRQLITGCFEAATHIRVPVLLLYAAHDVYIKPKRVEAFFALLASREKEKAFFPESHHLLLHDFDQMQVLQRVEAWLLNRIEAKTATT